MLGASDVKCPTLANGMNAGRVFFDLEFDDKSGKPTSVRYRDPSGQEYYYNYIHKNGSEYKKLAKIKIFNYFEDFFVLMTERISVKKSVMPAITTNSIIFPFVESIIAESPKIAVRK